MKRFLSISFTFLLAFVITYAGSGVNAYSFCCDDCHTYGIEAIAGDMCCDIHHSECSTEQDNTDNAICESSEQECTLDRLDIDLLDVSSQKSQTEISIKVLDTSFATLLPHFNQHSVDETINSFISQTQKPPNLSTLVYFSMLETLII